MDWIRLQGQSQQQAAFVKKQLRLFQIFSDD
jgi:hypothetical protein